jgi:hypothetical protein
MLDPGTFRKELFRIRSAELHGVVFENRSGADIQVREHRKRRKPRQAAG